MTHIYHVFEGPKPRRDAPLPKTGGRTVYRYDVNDTEVARPLWERFLEDQQTDNITTYINSPSTTDTKDPVQLHPPITPSQAPLYLC